MTGLDHDYTDLVHGIYDVWCQRHHVMPTGSVALVEAQTIETTRGIRRWQWLDYTAQIRHILKGTYSTPGGDEACLPLDVFVVSYVVAETGTERSLVCPTEREAICAYVQALRAIEAESARLLTEGDLPADETECVRAYGAAARDALRVLYLLANS